MGSRVPPRRPKGPSDEVPGNAVPFKFDGIGGPPGGVMGVTWGWRPSFYRDGGTCITRPEKDTLRDFQIDVLEGLWEPLGPHVGPIVR